MAGRGLRTRARDLLRGAGNPTEDPNEDRTEGPAGAPVSGLVEQFSRRLVAGWVSVPEDCPPVQVSLHLGDLRIAATYATPSPFMSGSQSVLRRADHPDAEPAAAPAAGALVHDWQRPNLPGPAEDRRNSTEQIRTFSFKVRGIWPFLKKRHRVTVRVDGLPLPIYGHGMFLNPPKNGKRSLEELRDLLDRGYLLTQFGRIELSKSLDEEWQRKVMDLYTEVRGFLSREYGYDAFFIGGTLLGAVREGGYIGHDVDFDAAYVSRHTTGPEAAEELVEIGLAFVRAGWAVECMRSNLHLMRPDDLDVRVDLFHVYFDEQDHFAFPWGIAGTSTVLRSDWRGTEEIDFPGGRGLVPANAEQMVEHLYGADWRLPKPGFNWHIDRTANAEEGNLSAEQRSVVFWADLHARSRPGPASDFARLVLEREDADGPVLDLGCGAGADTCAFAAAGRSTLGVDRSGPGVEAGRAHAAATGLDPATRFERVDLADAVRLGELLQETLAGDDRPATFYLRQVLCSVPEDVESTLLGTLAEHARPGDVLAVEVRGAAPGAEETGPPVPYRRLRAAAELLERLTVRGFDVVHTEDAGPGPDDEPGTVMHRVLLRR